MNLFSRFRELNRIGKTAVVLLILFVIYAAGAGLALPPFAKSRLESVLSEQLKRKTSIGKIRFNPFFLALSVEDLSVTGNDGNPFVAFRGLHVNVDPLASIVSRAICLKYLRLTEPDVRIHIAADGTPNFADLMESEEAEALESEEESSGELPAVIIGRTTVENGRVAFSDDSQREPFQVEISPINLDLSRFGTKLSESTPYDFLLRINEGAELNWKGTVSMSPPRSEGSLALSSVHLPRWKYLSEGWRFQISAGSLRASADYSFDGSGDEPVLVVDNGEIATENLEIGSKRRTETDVAVPSFAASGVTYDLGTNTLTVAKVESREGRLKVALAEDGKVSLQELFAPDESETAGEEEAAQPDPAASDEPAKPFQLKIEAVRVANYAVDLEDAMGEVQASVALSSINIGVDDLALSPGSKSPYTVGLDIQETGRIDVDGTFGIDPLALESHLKAANLPLAKFDPYVARGANLSVESGTADIDLRVSISDDASVSIENGSIEVRDLATTIDGAELADWQSLTIDGFALDLAGNRMEIDHVQLNEPDVAVHIDPEGVLNFSKLSSDPAVAEKTEEIEEALEEAKAEGDPFGFLIGELRITDGAVAITDESVDPAMALNVTNLQTVVENLTTDDETVSEMSIAAALDKTGSIKATAEINPIAAVWDGELDLEVTGLDARPFSPYLESGIGYRIKSGQIGVKADYEIDQDAFDGLWHIRAEEFDVSQIFGLNPTKLLPLGLAVEALKDMRGTINVELPVKGNRADPDYRPGGALGNALVSLITRAAASPFSLVGKLADFVVDDLRYVEFEPGSADLDGLQAQKLDALGAALLKKEKLVLQVSGGANPGLDIPGLARERVERRLKQVRFEQLKGKGPKDPADIVLTDKDRMRLLGDIYEEKFGESARSLEKRLRSDGKIGDEDDEDEIVARAMVRRLAESDPPSDDDLRTLADRRMARMLERVAAVEGLDESRVQVLEPNLDASGSGNRVRSELDLTTK